MLSLSAAEVACTRTLAAPRERVWELISDPHHQPRWWPGVERVEGVREHHFTQVMRTRRGRPVRLDFAIDAARAPEWLQWHQELAGTPFAGVLESCTVTFTLLVEAGGTTVTIRQAQRLRGSARTGGLMLRRATRRRLEQALDGLGAALLTAP